ncbi:DUF1549 domain-containing protein [bacterium]|nr:DUF1549 domain-containing protein [bacterium]
MIWAAAGLCFAFSVSAIAADKAPISPAAAQFFEREVRPLLAEHCFQCHGEQKQSGGLRLDFHANLMQGGESGPSIVPGKPAESLLIEAIRYESYEMPPAGKLPEKEIAILTKWVEMGAPWPGDNRVAGHVHRPGVITDEDRQWWAIQPVKRPELPEVPTNALLHNDIDRFIVAKLQEQGLSPAPQADRTSLIRRVTFDLIGLPPTPAEVEEFVNDPSPDAYERLVDRLLQRPEYGERWARHWLDLVRYADSDGYRLDSYRPNIWRYRDYVINAFNNDKPYDRFVQEQLAGDELFPDDPEALTATGYLRHWIYEYNSRDARGQWEIIMNDITDTTADVFLGLGLQCARCHDHKFDPLLQADYFRLQGFFAGILPQDHLIAATEAEKTAHAEALKEWETQTAELRAKIAELEAPARAKAAETSVGRFPDDVQAMIHKSFSERTPYEHQVAELAYRQVTYEWDNIDKHLKGETKDQVLALRKELAAFDKLKPADLPVVWGATDFSSKAADVTIPKRGPGLIDPGFPTILDPQAAAIAPIENNPNTTGRRAALAQWLTAPDNPLTGRVIVNRIWQQHFGKGLAVNTSDFGRLGEAPSHPQLLDWLTSEFIDQGWSIKKLQRQIVLSATYQQAVTNPQAEAAKLKDPENRWLWRTNLRRLDAEQIRDALYAASGALDLSRHSGPGEPNEQPVRSIYLRFMRNNRNALLDVFDEPLGINSTAARYTTTTPIQSLLLINSQLMLQQATALEKRLRTEAPAPEGRIDLAYRLLFGRPADSHEIAAAQGFLQDQVAHINLEEANSEAAKFEYDKIPSRDGQAAVMTPDHPAMQAPHQSEFPSHDFTIEAFVVVRSVYDSGAVRVMASSWSGSQEQPGWSFGITGKGSRRKPQTLVLELLGKTAEGKLVHDPIFSDHTIQLNRPYYVAAAVKFSDDAAVPGTVTFYVKDIGNDDEPLQSAVVPHRIQSGIDSTFPFTIGGRMSLKDARFDGLIDDVRLSAAALTTPQLLYTAEAAPTNTVGFWRFEPNPDVFADASGHGFHLSPMTRQANEKRLSAERQAWIDLCQVLLNSNEFLYVR